MIMKTLKEVALELGITPDSLRQRIARGSLKAIKIGTTWAVDTKTYNKLLEEKEHQMRRKEYKQNFEDKFPSLDDFPSIRKK